MRVSYSEHPPLPRLGAAPTTFYYIIPTLPQAGEGFLRTNQVLQSRSIQQPGQPTSSVSKFRKAEASRNYNTQHLQCPDFAKPKHPTTTTANIFSVQVSQSRSIQQPGQPTSSVSSFRKAEASRNHNTQHLQCPDFAKPKHPATTTSNTCNIRVLHNNSARQLKLSALETPNPSNARKRGRRPSLYPVRRRPAGKNRGER